MSENQRWLLFFAAAIFPALAAIIIYKVLAGICCLMSKVSLKDARKKRYAVNE
jgi:hypothetical protein